MRIISGTARGRRLFSPGQTKRPSTIRPTSDKVREAVFNILGKCVNDAEVLDMFAGTGALGLEALSRGGRTACFIDNSQAAIKLIKKNLDNCGFSDRASIFCRDLLKSTAFLNRIVPGHGFDLIFVDPPYRRQIAEKALKMIGMTGVLASGGQLVVEEDSVIDLPQSTDELERIDQRVYGDTVVCFYRRKGE